MASMVAAPWAWSRYSTSVRSRSGVSGGLGWIGAERSTNLIGPDPKPSALRGLGLLALALAARRDGLALAAGDRHLLGVQDGPLGRLAGQRPALHLRRA